MNHSDQPRQSRRSFIKFGSQIGLGVTAIPTSLAAASSASQKQNGELPRQPIERLNQLSTGRPKSFYYPDPASPCILIKTGKSTASGIGPDQDIVAYSLLCPHQGFPLVYDPERKLLKCANHFSQFDPEQLGQMVCGQSTVNLPRVVLEWDETSGQINAVGVQGLIYGRANNSIT